MIVPKDKRKLASPAERTDNAVVLNCRDGRELREAEQRYRFAIEGADLGTWDLHLPTGAMVLNERYSTMLGYRPGEIEPRYEAWASLVHPEDATRVANEFAAHLHGESAVFESEYRMRHRSGSWEWIIERGALIERNSDGGPLRVCGTRFDATFRKSAENLKRDLLNTVSHELRTPLTAIQGFVAAMLEDPELPPATRREFMQIVHDESVRLSQLVDQILQAARLQSAHVGSRREPVDLPALAHRSAQQLAGVAGQKSIQIRVDVDSPVPLLHADSGQLLSVISNLLGNAVKFTPPGGSVSVTLDARDGEIRIVVADSGIGIPAAEIDKIFDSFYRVQRPGMEIPGTGLGLAIVKTIVERHGGRIEVSSGENRGSTFRVFLPAVL